jgi:hypothetical protein
MRGHPIFVAQHATATCCRGCLTKWHRIPQGQPLTPELLSPAQENRQPASGRRTGAVALKWQGNADAIPRRCGGGHGPVRPLLACSGIIVPPPSNPIVGGVIVLHLCYTTAPVNRPCGLG